MTVIENCSVTIFIIIRRHFKFVDQMICLKKSIIISIQFQMQMKIHHFNFSKKKIFLFKFENANFEFYVHVMRFETADVLIRNDENKFIKMFRNFRLRRITEMKYFNVYFVINDIMNLIVKKSEQSHQKIYFQKLLRACLSNESQSDFVSKNKTVKIKKNIIIYNVDSVFTRRLTKLIKNYFIIGTDQDFVNLFQNE